MRTITLEEHFLTKEAIKATDHLRDSGLALSYHEPGLTERLPNIGAGRVADMDASGIDLASLSFPNTTIHSAAVVAAGAFPPPGSGDAQSKAYASLPAFCRVAATISPTTDSAIRVRG